MEILRKLLKNSVKIPEAFAWIVNDLAGIFRNQPLSMI